MQNCWVPGPFFLEKQTGRGVGRDAERGNVVEGESWRSVRSLPNKCWEAADSLKSRRQQEKDRAERAPGAWGGGGGEVLREKEKG